MLIPGITLTNQDGQIYLRGGPDSARAALTLQVLREALLATEFAGCAWDEEALASVVSQCNASQTTFVVPVASSHDAQVQIEVASDGMSASVTIVPPQGGKHVDMAMVSDALVQAGVVFGVSDEALALAAGPAPVDALLIARGAPSVDGEDARFIELVAETVDRAPKLNADGLIDYREHAAIVMVEAGAALMRRIPATPGIAGFNVRGEVLEPRPGRDEPFDSKLIGAQVSSENPNELCASVAGLPVRVAFGVNVEPVLRVANVNLATGNLYFDGTVQVDGEINPGMQVKASGDIVVGGTVDGAVLTAGGNILVAGGIISEARLTAGGSVSARFAQNASISAAQAISLDDMAQDCTLKSLNSVFIGVKASQRGKLVGGTCTAMMLVKVPTLGSSKGALTHVTVGANPELEARFKELQERIAKEAENENNLKRLVATLTKQGDPKGMLPRAQIAWRQAVQVWGKSLAERTELEKQLAQSRNARVEMTLGTSGEVDLALGSRRVKFRKEFGPGAFSIDTNTDLIFTTPAGQATKIA